MTTMTEAPPTEGQTLIKQGMKVLVHSRFREVKVMVGRRYQRHPSTGKPEVVGVFRTFKDNRCYMTPEEAAFVVDSDQNLRHIEWGFRAPYSYPAGMPFPVEWHKDGPFFAAENDDAVMASDPRAVLAADAIREEMALALQSGDMTPKTGDASVTGGANANFGPDGIE